MKENTKYNVVVLILDMNTFSSLIETSSTDKYQVHV